MTNQALVTTAVPAPKPHTSNGEPNSNGTVNVNITANANCNGFFSARPSNQTNGTEISTLSNGDVAAADASLFSPTLISPEVLAALPPGYTVRSLRRSDFKRGYLDVLGVLTTVGAVSEEQWNQRFDWIASRNDEYFLLVVCDETDRIVGTGSLIVERKFIHSLGLVGHIEDIAVEKGQQGKKLGLRIIQALDYVASHVGCYKSILDCSEANEGFYVKCGFKRAGLEMAHYY